MKGKKKGIVALMNSAGVSVTSTKGKLEVLKTHYRHLGSCSVDSAFDDSWKEEVDEQVSECSSVSKACKDRVLMIECVFGSFRIIRLEVVMG